VGDLQVPLKGEHTSWAWHFEYQVGVVGYLHELGDGRSAKDGVVGGLEVRDLELDVLGTVVVPRRPEGDWQPCDLGREPLPGAPAVGVLDRQPTKGSTRSR
jgi:hypothetical protein